MPDPWLNMGQEEELTPYVVLLSDVIGPWVIREMLNLGFHWEDIKNMSVETYNHIMSMYHACPSSLAFMNTAICHFLRDTLLQDTYILVHCWVLLQQEHHTHHNPCHTM